MDLLKGVKLLTQRANTNQNKPLESPKKMAEAR